MGVGGQTWNILIIAESAELRAELRRLLEAGSPGRYAVVEAETGTAGMRRLKAGEVLPDCVLLAHEPPSLDALEVLTALRAARPVPSCPVVILSTGEARGRDVERMALRAGAMECVDRHSLSTQVLTRAIENAMDRFTPWRTKSSSTETSRAQLEALVNAVADGVVVFDMAGNVVLLNEAEARINGFASVAEMMRDLPFFAELYELSLEDGRLLPVEQWPVSRVLRGETLTQCRLRARRRDTGQWWHIDFSGTPVRDEAGRQVFALVITRDVTDQVRAEEALRASQRRYQTLFESIDEGFCILQMIFDEHGKPIDYRFLETNAAF